MTLLHHFLTIFTSSKHENLIKLAVAVMVTVLLGCSFISLSFQRKELHFLCSQSGSAKTFQTVSLIVANMLEQAYCSRQLLVYSQWLL